MDCSQFGKPITKAAMLRKLTPGTKMFSERWRKNRTVSKATSHQLVVVAEDKPDKPLSYLTFGPGDKFYESDAGWTHVASDCVLTYSWGHKETVEAT